MKTQKKSVSEQEYEAFSTKIEKEIKTRTNYITLLALMFVFSMILFILNGCGMKEVIEEAQEEPKLESTEVTTDELADSIVIDEQQNDNLTLVETQCEFDPAHSAFAKQVFESEALGDDYKVVLNFSGLVKEFENYKDGIYTQEMTDSSCDSPGYSVYLKETDRVQYIYGCGGSCAYTLNDYSLDDKGAFSYMDLTWECQNVKFLNTYNHQGNFGPSIDKQKGRLICD